MEVVSPAEQLFFVTCNLAGRSGDDGATGTGFLYNVPTDHGDALYLVSNRHVFENASDLLRVRMLQRTPEGQPNYGKPAILDWTDINEVWQFHPDPKIDVGVIPFAGAIEGITDGGRKPVYFKTVPASVALTSETARDLDAIEDVVFIGYPNNLYDTRNLTPIARRGTTATPVALDYDGHPAFLVDASVFPGSSGSPVFLFDRTPTHRTKAGDAVIGAAMRFFLLGLVAAVHVREAEGRLVETKLGVVVKDPINLGIVFKASAVDECIDIHLASEGLTRLRSAPPS